MVAWRHDGCHDSAHFTSTSRCDSRPLVCSPYQGYRLLLIGSCPGRRMNPHTCSTPRHYASTRKGPTTTGGVGRELDLAGQVDASSPRRGRMSDRGYPPKSPTSRHVVRSEERRVGKEGRSRWSPY